MNALFLPNHDDNPYQLLLARALEAHGVSVTGGSSSDLFPLLSGAFHQKPDVIHFHWLHQFVIGRTRTRSVAATLRFMFELLVVRLLGITIVWTVHNILQHERNYPRFERQARKQFVRLCDEIIVHSPAARERVMEEYNLPAKYEDKITVIPHGNYIESYENTVSKTEARERLEMDDAGMIYLFFGNIRSYKNVPELISAFRAIEDEDARLLIAGSPPNDPIESERLTNGVRADERIRTDFTYIPDDDIQLYMNAADAVVLPFSRVLTSGSAILSMSFGTPVIAPRLGCLPDMLGDKGELLYDPTEPNALQEIMEHTRTEGLDSLGDRTYERAKEFGWEGIAERTRAVYRSGIDDRPTEPLNTDTYDWTRQSRSSATVADGGEYKSIRNNTQTDSAER